MRLRSILTISNTLRKPKEVMNELTLDQALTLKCSKLNSYPDGKTTIVCDMNSNLVREDLVRGDDDVRQRKLFILDFLGGFSSVGLVASHLRWLATTLWSEVE